MGTNSIRLLNRRAAYFAAAIAMVFATFIPVLVSAAQATERSVQLSSSSAQATGVSYKVNFKPATSGAEAFVVEFCSNTPLVSEACTAPTGLNVGTPSSATAGFTDVAKLTNNANNAVRVVPASALTTTAVSVDIAGLTNPTSTGAIYVRIITFGTEAQANAYSSASNGVTEGSGGVIDTGSVALSITPTIGVSGAVLETMTFCVAKIQITENCGNAAGSPPNVTLGVADSNGAVALDATRVDEGQISTQVSTNASGGVVIRLKSNALGCGGLLRAGAPSACDIAPAVSGNTGISFGQAKFGVKLGAAGYATSGATSASGTLQNYSGGGSIYSDSAFAMNYVVGDASGVTSVYGDPILDTDDLPANNQNMDLTFGASISNTTPAGAYSADLSLIATGKF